MKFVEKCPKCGSEVQTKSLKKSIGLGFVDIPVAQFCLNPQCDWYQDFSEAKKPEEIKEDVLQIKIPSLKNKIPDAIPKISSRKKNPKSILVLGGIIVFIAILFFYLIPQFTHPQDAVKINASVTGTPAVNTTQGSVFVPASTPTIALAQRRSYPIKMDVAHGFNPPVININRSDTIVWGNEEQQRTRIVLISKEGLFENKITEYAKKTSYQFNKSGTYNFILAAYPSLNEYQNTTGKVIVK